MRSDLRWCAGPASEKTNNRIMKLFKSLLLAGAVAFVCRDVSAQYIPINPVGFLNVQGVLHENGQPVNGFMWFCFDVFAAPTGGTLPAPTATCRGHWVKSLRPVGTLVFRRQREPHDFALLRNQRAGVCAESD